jgi:hypothetical protein
VAGWLLDYENLEEDSTLQIIKKKARAVIRTGLEFSSTGQS